MSSERGPAFPPHVCECCGEDARNMALDPEQGDLWFCDECYPIVTAEVESRG